MSDDYTRVSTPSTADVREYFAFGDFHAWSERVPERYELFDAWLAEHDRQVAAGWADYFEHWGSTLGSTQELDAPMVARLLRGPKPLGTHSGKAPHG